MSEKHHEVASDRSDGDRAFVVGVPALPARAADGKTREEALRNAEAAIQVWIETAQDPGRPVPALPRRSGTV